MGIGNGDLKKLGLTNSECADLAELTSSVVRDKTVAFCSSYQCAGHATFSARGVPIIALKGDYCAECGSLANFKTVNPVQVPRHRERALKVKEQRQEKLAKERARHIQKRIRAKAKKEVK